MKKYKNLDQYFAYFLISISIASLPLALLIESLGFLPCKLCYLQRVIYTIIGVCAFLYLKFKRRHLFLLITPVVILFAVSFFQVGLEERWWSLDIGCTSIFDTSHLNPESYFAQLESKDLVSCDVKQSLIFGLTLPDISLIFACFSMILAMLITKIKLCRD